MKIDANTNLKVEKITVELDERVSALVIAATAANGWGTVSNFVHDALLNVVSAELDLGQEIEQERREFQNDAGIPVSRVLASR